MADGHPAGTCMSSDFSARKSAICNFIVTLADFVCRLAVWWRVSWQHNLAVDGHAEWLRRTAVLTRNGHTDGECPCRQFEMPFVTRSSSVCDSSCCTPPMIDHISRETSALVIRLSIIFSSQGRK